MTHLVCVMKLGWGRLAEMLQLGPKYVRGGVGGGGEEQGGTVALTRWFMLQA